MAFLYSVDAISPVIHAGAHVSDTATLIGDVIVGNGCYVGPSASLRGDFGRIWLQDGSSVQDCCVVHTGSGRETVLHTGAIVGHGAVLHGCVVGTNALVGMNSVVLDGASIGERSMIGAMSLVPKDFVVPPRKLAIGIPLHIVRDLTDDEIAYLANGEEHYRELHGRLSRIDHPMAAMTAERWNLRFGGETRS